MIAATPKNTLDKVKTHIRENKKYYVTGGLVVGAAAIGTAGYILGTKTSPKEVENAITTSIKQQGLVWKSSPTIEVTVEALGDPGNIIQDTTTGTIYASQNQAAKALNVSRWQISNHLKGLTDNVEGHELVKLGKAYVDPSA